MRPFVDPRPLPRAFKSLLKAPRALTARFRPVPDFIIIGAQRAGTTSLYRYLGEHPAILPAFRKEVHFFDLNFEKGLDWYRAHFPSGPFRYLRERMTGSPTLTGEASVYYLFHPHAARRASVTVPQAKLIALLRNPVDRAYSHYQHERRRCAEELPFEDAVRAEADRLDAELRRMRADQYYYSEAHRRRSYLARGIYVDQLRTWMSLFPRAHFLILRSEDLFADPAGILSQTLAFLGLHSWPLAAYRVYNHAGYSSMARATRERLLDYFEPHNKRLAELLDRKFDWER